MTLLLGAQELRRLLNVAPSLKMLRDGFLANERDVAAQRVRQELPSPGTAMVLLPGLLPGIPAYTVKVNAKFPDAERSISGIICLHDLHNGNLLGVLDSAFVTAWRTGLSAALGIHHLAGHPLGTLGVIGAGAQARMTMRGLRALRDVPCAVIHDSVAQRAHRLAESWQRIGIRCQVVNTPGEAAAMSDSLLVATWAREPLLHLHDVHPGMHITSLGADEPGKQELDPELLRRARLFVDDLDLSMSSGVLGSAGLARNYVAGTLTDVLASSIATSGGEDADVTVYSPVGLPWQDLAISWGAYQLAQSRGTTPQFQFHGHTADDESLEEEEEENSP